MSTTAKVIIGVLLIVLIYSIVRTIQLTKEITERNARIYQLDSLKKLDETTYMQLVEDLRNKEQSNAALSLQNKKLSSVIDKNDETIRILNQTVLKLSNKSYQGTDFTDTTLYKIVYVKDTVGNYLKVPIGGDTVRFAEDYGSFLSLSGRTWLWPNKSYLIDITGKQITLDLVLTEDENGAYNSYIDVNDPLLSVIKFNTKINRSDQTKSFWANVSGIAGFNVTNKNGFVIAGLSYKRLGLTGVYGYSFDGGLKFDTDHQMFGGGIYLNF